MKSLLERSQRIPRPRREVFAFFEDAANLERITPPFLRFAIETELPIVMREGALIDYKLSLYALPLRWRTRIERYEAPERFVDCQVRGPYRSWRHTHELFANGPDATIMVDRVEYELPLGPIGGLAKALFVERTLERIFDYRRDAIERLFCESGGPTGAR